MNHPEISSFSLFTCGHFTGIKFDRGIFLRKHSECVENVKITRTCPFQDEINYLIHQIRILGDTFPSTKRQFNSDMQGNTFLLGAVLLIQKLN